MTRRLLLPLVALLLVAPPAGAKPRQVVKPQGLQVDAVVASGGKLDVRLAKPVKAVPVVLSADRKAGKGDLRLGKVKRRARLTVPAQVKPGRYFVVACLKKRCAAKPTTVAVAPKSSQDLIAAALAAGRLTPAQALTYRVFAAFGDRRLPAGLQGAPGEDHALMRELAASWAGLPAAAQKQVAPFLRPPAARRSWLNLPTTLAAPVAPKRKAKVSRSIDDLPQDACDAEQMADISWSSVAGAGGKIRVWWHRPELRNGALNLAHQLGPIYERLKTAWGRDLLSDGSIPCFHGVDGALDVYFIDDVKGAYAMTIPSATSGVNQLQCDGTPSYIVVQTMGGAPGAWSMAHELSHAFQLTYPYKNDCREYLSFDEGSAHWGANEALPADNTEHNNLALIRAPDTSLRYWSGYDLWMFFLSLSRTQGAGVVPAIYRAFGEDGPYTAIEKATGGWHKRWREFGRFMWNRAPVEPSFRQWDAIENTPPTQDVALTLAGQAKRTLNLPYGSLENLANHYHRLTVADEDIKEMRYVNPRSGDPAFGVQAILTMADGSTREEDWTGRDKVVLCRDEDEIAEIVLIYSNAEWREKGKPAAGEEPELRLRDACDDLPWRYRVLSAGFQFQTAGSKTPDNSGVCGYAEPPIASSGTTIFKGEGAGFPDDPADVIERGADGSLFGTIYAELDAKWFRSVKGCLIGEEAIVPCSSDREEPGRATIGVSVKAASKDAGQADLVWSIEAPSIGYSSGATEEMCNVYTMQQEVTDADRAGTASLRDLESDDPVTLHVEGGGDWSTDSMGQPAHLSSIWTATVTVQRIVD